MLSKKPQYDFRFILFEMTSNDEFKNLSFFRSFIQFFFFSFSSPNRVNKQMDSKKKFYFYTNFEHLYTENTLWLIFPYSCSLFNPKNTNKQQQQPKKPKINIFSIFMPFTKHAHQSYFAVKREICPYTGLTSTVFCFFYFYLFFFSQLS